MCAGSLDQRVAFDPPVSAPDGHGGTEVGWDESRRVEASANFKYLRGGETVQAARLQGRQPIVVTIYSSSASRAISPAWRMRNLRDDTIYNIRSGPVPSDDRRVLEFTVEAGVAV